MQAILRRLAIALIARMGISIPQVRAPIASEKLGAAHAPYSKGDRVGNQISIRQGYEKSLIGILPVRALLLLMLNSYFSSERFVGCY